MALATLPLKELKKKEKDKLPKELEEFYEKWNKAKEGEDSLEERSFYERKELGKVDNIVSNAFDKDDSKEESIDDIFFEGEREIQGGYVESYKNNDSDRMEFPDLGDEQVFSGELERKGPWSN